MKTHMLKKARVLIAGLSLVVLGACATTGPGNVAGNDNGSAPVNDKETVDYQKAVLKCYKSGGSRVVKITGDLRCF